MNRKLLKEMFNFTKNKNETIVIGIILVLQLLLYTFFYPFIMQEIVDKAIPEENMKIVILLSIILIGIVVLRFFTNSYTGVKRKSCYYKNNMEIKEKLFKSIQKAEISKVEQMQTGSLFEIVFNQSYEASQLFVWNFVGIISVRLALTIAISIILLLLNVKLGLIIISIFIISYCILIPIYRKTMKVYKNLQTMLVNLQANVNEYIDSYATTKTLRLEETNLAQIKEMLEKSKKQILKANKIIAMHNSLFSILTFAATISIIIVGGNELMLGIGVSSTIMLMVDYVDDINKHMKSLLDHVHNLNNRYACFYNVLKTEKIKKEEDTGTNTLKGINKIEFKEVSLSYDGINTILENVNFKVEKPMQIAIVGKSGAGKTSLINLLPRFYEINNGSILINEIDSREYKLKELRKNIAYVFQEPVIFEKSISENLKFGNKKEITQDQIEKVCREIGLHEKICKLPNKYNTIINAKTDLLSYGEKQLLSFARAILKQADLILLDEVTSNLDLEFEENVMKAMQEMLKDKISFVIAHRLNTIKNSDLILFLEDKHIVEAGTHEELMQKKGRYYKLYSSKKETILK